MVCVNFASGCGSLHLGKCQKMKIIVYISKLAGKYRWRESPAVITGNYRPGKYSKFWQSGKYEILELFELKYAAIFL